MPAKLSTKPRLTHSAANPASPEKQCITTRRRALLVEHPQHVGVGVAVVDRPAPCRTAWRWRCGPGSSSPAPPGPRPRCGSGPARSRRCPHPRPRGQRLDLAQRLVQVGQPGSLVGVQGHRGQHRAVRVGQVGAPGRGGHVHPHLHQAVDPDRGRRGDLGRRVAADDVEVGVAVQHRDGQRFRRGRRLTLAGRRSRLAFSSSRVGHAAQDLTGRSSGQRRMRSSSPRRK